MASATICLHGNRLGKSEDGVIPDDPICSDPVGKDIFDAVLSLKGSMRAISAKL
jgi:hypothetical protein